MTLFIIHMFSNNLWNILLLYVLQVTNYNNPKSFKSYTMENKQATN